MDPAPASLCYIHCCSRPPQRHGADAKPPLCCSQLLMFAPVQPAEAAPSLALQQLQEKREMEQILKERAVVRPKLTASPKVEPVSGAAGAGERQLADEGPSGPVLGPVRLRACNA